jgi:hypothetical protein
MNEVGELAPYLLLVLVGFLPNEVWRWIGIALVHGIDEDSEIIVWVRAVATAILTGVVGKVLVFAPGALATVPLAVRLGAAAAGLIAYVVVRRSVFAGVGVGTASILVGSWIAG